MGTILLLQTLMTQGFSPSYYHQNLSTRGSWIADLGALGPFSGAQAAGMVSLFQTGACEAALPSGTSVTPVTPRDSPAHPESD